MKKLQDIVLMMVFVLIYSTSIFSQKETAAILLDKVSNFYRKTAQYQIDMNYKMLKGLTGNEVTESYSGALVKNHQASQFTMANTEMVTIANEQLVIDNDQKLIILRKSEQEAMTSVIDVNSFLEYYQESDITNEGGYLKCELIAKPEKMSLPYAKIILFVNPNDYSVAKQELYFSSQLPFKLDTGLERDFGRMLIEMKTREIGNAPKLSFDAYFQKKESDQKQLVDRYKGYEFIDETKR